MHETPREGLARAGDGAAELRDVALYYTFSTIAQSLASALAVLAAFILFRLPHPAASCLGDIVSPLTPWAPRLGTQVLLCAPALLVGSS